MTTNDAIAVNRFGLGARAGDTPPADPKVWLRGQQAAWNPRPPEIAAAPSSAAMAAQFRSYLAELRSTQIGDMGEAPKVTGADAAEMLRKNLRALYRDSYGSQARARIATALTSPTPFAERLTYFWANHFAISADKLQSIGLAGTLEFEAIRPHIYSRFGDMLHAVETHPAMLLYLDQAQSIGPDSVIGTFAARRPNAARKVGLNENLAREILELHTLGVDGGYTQADVQQLAAALSGWSVGGFVKRPVGIEAPDGAFVFQPGWHQPGTRSLLGRSYAQNGVAQGQAMLADLAVHPATAHHLATKLARHFAGDTPPPALVDRLIATHLRTGGDLPALYAELIDAPEIWAVPQAKFKTPWDWMISALRGIGAQSAPDLKIVGALSELGQPVWRPGSPAGWEDTTAAWAAPDALLRRVEVAQRLGLAVGDQLNPSALGTRLLGATLTPASATAIAAAESPAQGIALLLVAPEFLRR